MSEQGLLGSPVQDVVAAIVDRDDDRDPEIVREALDPITDDGVVTTDAVESAVSDTSKLLATVETRVELADIAYDDAREAADGVDDVAVVAARLEAYGDRLEDVTSRTAGLSDDLNALDGSPDDPDAVYDLAVGLRQVAAEAQSVAREADDLSFDLEGFEAWVGSPTRRHDEFEEDIDHVEERLDELAAATEALPSESDAPAADWADATMRTRVVDLLVEDLRAELTDLRTLADREEAQVPDALGDRVAALDRRVEELIDSLAERADPAWRDRYGDDIAAFERDLAAIDPPVDWTRVQRTFDDRRETTFDDR